MTNLTARNWPIYLGPRREGFLAPNGDRESGQQEVFGQDPDGYLLMLAQNVGERALRRRIKIPGARALHRNRRDGRSFS